MTPGETLAAALAAYDEAETAAEIAIQDALDVAVGAAIAGLPAPAVDVHTVIYRATVESGVVTASELTGTSRRPTAAERAPRGRRPVKA